MGTRKRNEYLDAEESEDDDRGYDSEEESRARMLPASKRRKTGNDSEDEEQDEDEDTEDQEDDEEDEDDTAHLKNKKSELEHLEKLAASLPADLKLQTTQPGKLLPTEVKKDKSGVIYLSRVPPFMKPNVLRTLLTPYGALGRIFLTPESSTNRTQRVRGGGSRRKLYLDGWVEFLHKRDAKFVAENLNAQIMGGKKRSHWHDEVWNVKYLSGVKWSHLVEQIQNENAERTARLRFEIAQGKKENKAFLENVERGKAMSGIEATRKRRGDGEELEEAVGKDEAMAEGEKPRRKKERREFTQHTAMSKALKKPEPGQDVGKVLGSMM